MAYISFDFEFPLPNDFLVDHSQSQGKTKTMTYHGPDKIFLYIDKETGKEKYGPVTEDDLADGSHGGSYSLAAFDHLFHR